MSSDLKQKTVNGLAWSSIDRFSNQGIQFVISIVLARILEPSDYGVVAMTFIFFAIANTFVDSGFGNALIRKPTRTEEDLSTCFFFNVVIGITAYVILFLIAPLAASFYNQPILTPIVRISGLSVLIGSFGIVQMTLLKTRIDFKTNAKISLTATIVSGIIGIIVAYCGYGVWALVWQGVTNSFINMLMLWCLVSWHPKAGFSRESFHYLFGYGSKLLVSGLIDTAYNNIYPVVIGKFYSSAQLGNFARAQAWASLPSSNITGIIQRVTFPVLSLIQENDERLADDYRRLLKMSAYIIFPMMMGLAAVASPLVRIVITEKWDACVPYLQIICFAMMWYPIHAINLNLLQVKGRSDLFLRLEIFKKILGLSIMCVTIPLGITAMCFGMIVSSILSLIINTFYTGKLIDVGFFKQMKDLLPILIISLIMGGGIYLFTFLFSVEWIKLTVSTMLGVIIYLFLSRFFAKNELAEVIDILKRK